MLFCCACGTTKQQKTREKNRSPWCFDPRFARIETPRLTIFFIDISFHLNVSICPSHCDCDHSFLALLIVDFSNDLPSFDLFIVAWVDASSDWWHDFVVWSFTVKYCTVSGERNLALPARDKYEASAKASASYFSLASKVLDYYHRR